MWSTGSWLIAEYLRTHPGASGEAVRRGDHLLKFYEDIQGIAEYLRSLYGRLDGNSLLVELDGYIYNLTDYYVYRKFLDDF